MTDPDVEDLLRETFQAREAQAPRLSRVRPTPRRTPWIAAGAGTLAVLAGAIVAANAVRGPAPTTLDQPSPSAVSASVLAPGWRWESSIGAQIQVPETWAVNDYGCLMSGKPTVDRGMRSEPACFTPESTTKEVAFITSAANADGALTPQFDPINSPSVAVRLPLHPVTVSGVAAERGEGRLDDGRYTGLVKVPQANVAVVVRTLDQAVTTRILDSLQLVDVDYAGCPLTAPSVTDVKTVPGRPAVPSTAPKLALCNYYTQPQLQSSAQVTGADADELLATLLALKEGPNSTVPCTWDPPATPDLVIRPDGGVPLMVLASGCGVRGITDGEHWLRLDEALLRKIAQSLHEGYSFIPPLD